MTASRQEQIKVRNLIFKKCSFCLKPKSITKIAIKTSVLKERGSETKKKICGYSISICLMIQDTLNTSPSDHCTSQIACLCGVFVWGIRMVII